MKSLWTDFCNWCELHFGGVVVFVIFTFLVATGLFLIVICGMIISQIKKPDHPEIIEKNRVTLSTNGTLIGNLPDGRDVRLYKIDRGNYRDHYIYVIDGAKTTSLNMPYKEGKQTKNQTVITAELE